MSTFLVIAIFVGICIFTVRTIVKNNSSKTKPWDGGTGTGIGGSDDKDTNPERI